MTNSPNRSTIESVAIMPRLMVWSRPKQQAARVEEADSPIGNHFPVGTRWQPETTPELIQHWVVLGVSPVCSRYLGRYRAEGLYRIPYRIVSFDLDG